MVDWWTAICTVTYNSLLAPDPEVTQHTVQKAVSPSLSTRLRLNIPATLTSLRDCFYGAGKVSPIKKMALARLEVLTTVLVTIQLLLEVRRCPWAKRCLRLKRSECLRLQSQALQAKCGLVFLEDDGSLAHQNLGNCFPNDTTSRSIRLVILKQSSFPKLLTVPLIFIKHTQWVFLSQ